MIRLFKLSLNHRLLEFYKTNYSNQYFINPKNDLLLPPPYTWLSTFAYSFWEVFNFCEIAFVKVSFAFTAYLSSGLGLY